jgi:hypothetical protein
MNEEKGSEAERQKSPNAPETPVEPDAEPNDGAESERGTEQASRRTPPPPCGAAVDASEDRLAAIEQSLIDIGQELEYRGENERRRGLKAGFFAGMVLGFFVLPIGRAVLKALLHAVGWLFGLTAAAMDVPVSDLIGAVSGAAIAFAFIYLLLRFGGRAFDWLTAKYGDDSED